MFVHNLEAKLSNPISVSLLKDLLIHPQTFVLCFSLLGGSVKWGSELCLSILSTHSAQCSWAIFLCSIKSVFAVLPGWLFPWSASGLIQMWLYLSATRWPHWRLLFPESWCCIFLLLARKLLLPIMKPPTLSCAGSSTCAMSSIPHR